eukprot:Plantae.Rhodophyta-Hildenbrandia_rubra.ctg7853.p1 GENE.Plantae.Rhodophyta-Hildenbrandia_rubra.ctg7853~~Plantae.Rhodophyta-Hildenbrandia_rubra.ctg7853.p1  ORF type:complete len:238 (+),score=63.10 Plantae.Rhodophyta-Hildenbrandia_rubra.ctg7853:202-915(+)
MASGAIRNMAVMLWAMSYMKTLDQEDPRTILYIRLAFSGYLLIGLLLNLYLHHKIMSISDQTLLKVPPKPPSPFAPPPPPSSDNDDNEDETPKDDWKTVMEYDLSVLSASRFSWISNAVLLTLIHFKMGTVAPMVMSGIMGLNRFYDDPLVQLHLLGRPAVGKLKRPFEAEKNPMMGMLSSMMGIEGPKKEEEEKEEKEAVLAGSDDEEDEVEIVEVDESEDELVVGNGNGEGKKDK